MENFDVVEEKIPFEPASATGMIELGGATGGEKLLIDRDEWDSDGESPMDRSKWLTGGVANIGEILLCSGECVTYMGVY